MESAEQSGLLYCKTDVLTRLSFVSILLGNFLYTPEKELSACIGDVTAHKHSLSACRCACSMNTDILNPNQAIWALDDCTQSLTAQQH